jgi:hypothetical protein
MPSHDHSTLKQPVPYVHENGSPDVKFILLLVFNLTFQGLENAFVLKRLGPVKMKLLLLLCSLACILYILVLFIPSEQLIVFHASVLTKK